MRSARLPRPASLARSLAAAGLLVAASCGDGTYSAPGGAPPDGGAAAAPVLGTWELEALPAAMAVLARWEAPGADRCSFEGPALLEVPPPAGPAGALTLPVEPAVGEGSVALVVRCVGEGGTTSGTAVVAMPWVRAFAPDPDAAGPGEVVLCWDLEGGEAPLTCAIHAEGTDEYYYPLEAEGCLFPLPVGGQGAFRLYCTAGNGYAERTLEVAARP